MPRIDRGVKMVLDALFPMRCVACDAIDPTGLCPRCSAGAPRVENPCPRCGAPLGAGQGNLHCGRCLSRPPAFDATVAPFAYAPPLSGVVHRFKYRGRIALGRPLAGLLARAVRQRGGDLPQLLVPVPLHWSRLMRRGFNQSLELCRHLSAELGIPLDRTAVRRTRRTRPQTGLPSRLRRGNVRGGFELVGAPAARSIAIVDDVITTGETVQQVALRLRSGGARTVQCWALLRADR